MDMLMMKLRLLPFLFLKNIGIMALEQNFRFGKSRYTVAVFLLDYLDAVFSQTKFWQVDCSCDIANLSVFTEWNNDAAFY